jgi:hypothetical protein
MSVADGAGYLWALNADGLFFRAAPGTNYEPADPSIFAVTHAPAYVAPVMPTMPVPPHLGGQGTPSHFTPGEPTPPTGYQNRPEYAAHVPETSPSNPYGNPYAHQNPSSSGGLLSRLRPPSRAPRPGRASSANAASIERLIARTGLSKRSLSVAVVVLVIFGVVIVEGTQKKSPTTSATTTSAPRATTTTTPPTTTAPPIAIPTSTRVASMLTTLVSASPAGAVRANSTSQRGAFDIALLVGAHQLGYTLSASQPVTAQHRQSVVLKHAGVSVAHATLVWVSTSRGWLISTWPTFLATP